MYHCGVSVVVVAVVVVASLCVCVCVRVIRSICFSNKYQCSQKIACLVRRRRSEGVDGGDFDFDLDLASTSC